MPNNFLNWIPYQSNHNILISIISMNLQKIIMTPSNTLKKLQKFMNFIHNILFKIKCLINHILIHCYHT